jgi:putative copper export protein
MDVMTIAMLIAATWMVGLLAVVAVCRSAARGDRVLRTQMRRRFSADSHEFHLTA